MPVATPAHPANAKALPDMHSLHKDVWLGIGTIVFGAMLLLYAIPEFISAPSNVTKLVLSPFLWPTIVAWLIILFGVALIASHLLTPSGPGALSDSEAFAFETFEDKLHAWARLGGVALLMVGLVVGTPTLGLVIASVLVFALFSIIARAPRPWLSLIVAVILPIVLYFFFAHVAGVSIPQGRFISLP